VKHGFATGAGALTLRGVKLGRSGETDLKRPQQHVTDSRGNALFRQAFAEWTVNPSEQDYGWDYIVERFKDGTSTGLLFSAQLKSSTHTQYSSDGSFISQPLERKAADYLARQLQIPSFLFHAGVNREKLFWNAIQLDEPIRAALESSNTDQFTVRIRTSNVLPDKLERFVTDLIASQNAIVRRILLGTNAADFFAGFSSNRLSEFERKRKTSTKKDFSWNSARPTNSESAGNFLEQSRPSGRYWKSLMDTSLSSSTARYSWASSKRSNSCDPMGPRAFCPTTSLPMPKSSAESRSEVPNIFTLSPRFLGARLNWVSLCTGHSECS
jgi:hypothetical protein